MEGQGEPRDAVVDSFCAITASTREVALFFLESHNWHLDSAIQSFYEADESDGGAAPPLDGDGVAPPPPPLLLPSPPPPSSGLPAAATSSRRDKKPSATAHPTIRTLADLSHQNESGSDSDSEEPQEYYTGGEKSGMLVQDPSKGKHDVDAIFDRARQSGATQVPAEHLPSSSSRSFTGTGRLLSGETAPTAPQQPDNIIHNICFWRNGFTVNNGPLRRFDDPENASFLESIAKSECPKELEAADRRSAVHVHLQRKDENCPEPVKRRALFHGVGRTLGDGLTDAPVPEPAASAATASASSPPIGLSVDASLPSTSIQLRLADGTRLVARFNIHHTVGDIRGFIDASRPGAPRTYRLQTVDFPPKQLADSSATIEQASLANSVVIQKL